MRITTDQAREYFADPSQHIMGITPESLPEADDFMWFARGDICVVFHLAPHPNIYMAHFAVKPEGRGKSDGDAKDILSHFWQTMSPDAIIGWTPAECRHAIAFAKRIGFRTDGFLAGKIVMQSWRPEWASVE